MKDIIYLLFFLFTTVAKLLRPGGNKTIIAENLLLKQQLITRRTSTLHVRKSLPQKKPHPVRGAASSKNKSWRCPTLTWGDPTLPSALYVFTSEFEMESGGSHTLLPPENWFRS